MMPTSTNGSRTHHASSKASDNATAAAPQPTEPEPEPSRELDDLALLSAAWTERVYPNDEEPFNTSLTYGE